MLSYDEFPGARDEIVSYLRLISGQYRRSPSLFPPVATITPPACQAYSYPPSHIAKLLLAGDCDPDKMYLALSLVCEDAEEFGVDVGGLTAFADRWKPVVEEYEGISGDSFFSKRISQLVSDRCATTAVASATAPGTGGAGYRRKQTSRGGPSGGPKTSIRLDAFYAVRLNALPTHAVVAEVQAQMLSAAPFLGKAMMPPSDLHLTCCVNYS